MRWKTKDSIRIQTGFLFLPKTINYQTRWLEFARWEEVLEENEWHIVKWINV
jgi:hypothetical protein